MCAITLSVASATATSVGVSSFAVFIVVVLDAAHKTTRRCEEERQEKLCEMLVWSEADALCTDASEGTQVNIDKTRMAHQASA